MISKIGFSDQDRSLAALFSAETDVETAFERWGFFQKKAKTKSIQHTLAMTKCIQHTLDSDTLCVDIFCANIATDIPFRKKVGAWSFQHTLGRC